MTGELRPVQWTLHYINDDIPCESFQQAVKEMMRRVQSEPVLMWQVLETAIWIQPSEKSDLPIMFYVARDIAAELGWSEEFKRTA